VLVVLCSSARTAPDAEEEAKSWGAFMEAEVR